MIKRIIIRYDTNAVGTVETAILHLINKLEKIRNVKIIKTEIENINE